MILGEVTEPTEIVDEYTVGGTRVKIITLSAPGAQQSQQRLRDGYRRAARMELFLLRQENPPPPPGERNCSGS